METIRNIAIAMDHLAHREQLADLLKALGYNVVLQTCTAKDFIAGLRREATDCICIIEVRMGSIIAGPSLCTQIKNEFPRNRIVCYSMCIDAEIIDGMYKSGLNAFVNKGVELDYLLHVISEEAAIFV